MGLTVELVKSVFSKNRSVITHDDSGRNFGVDKSRWSVVRSFVCGDDCNSGVAEDDSASIKSSEATVTQPITVYLKDDENQQEVHTGENEDYATDEKPNSPTKCIQQDKAATVIQSAFRGLLARRRYGEIKRLRKGDNISGTESPSKESVGTSIEVQTGDSADLRIRKQNLIIHHKVPKKAGTHISRLKEEWDASTVSSNISKMRIRNRLEAMTRRQRALAYAFSQQLRTCTKKKPTHSDGSGSNLGWSWLEQWMETRLPENSSVIEDRLSKCFQPISSDQRNITMKISFDAMGEEESCGSNDISVRLDALSITEQHEKDGHRPIKNRFKATRSVSRRKTVPSYQLPAQSTKASKKDHFKEAEKAKKHGPTQTPDSGEIKCRDTSSQTPY